MHNEAESTSTWGHNTIGTTLFLLLVLASSLAAQTPAVAGSWLMTFSRPPIGDATSPSVIPVLLEQRENQISGSFGSQYYTTTLSGTIYGFSLTIDIFSGNQLMIEFTGTVSPDANTISGTGGIAWSGTRVSGQALVLGATSAASFDPRQLAPLGYVSVFGSGLADGTYSAPDTNYGTKLGSTEIFICDKGLGLDGTVAADMTCSAARIAFASPNQVNVVLPDVPTVPPSRYSGGPYIVARIGGVLDAGTLAGTPLAIAVQPYAPAIFLAGSDCPIDGSGSTDCELLPGAPVDGRVQRGTVTDVNGNLVWSGNRAHLGQYYTIWLTGLNVIPQANSGGGILAGFSDVPTKGYRPTGGPVKVTYAGASPEYPGLYQVNFQIPLDIGEGPAGYGAWPCGDYDWEVTLEIAEGDDLSGISNDVRIPLSIRNGDVPCTQ